MKKYSNLLLKVSSVFALAGAAIGGHMAGSGDYAFRPIHAHILVVGWLTMFSWAVYYRLFQPKSRVLAGLHVYSAIIGAVGLTGGMALYNFRPAFFPAAVETGFYIGGGAVLLLSFLLFCILTFTQNDMDSVKE
ncbi:hypothetical protein BIV60_19430 [Bacillus sp. MUM 116]|uniref:Cbb3-type cytochrome c oxidase subunit I n=1 Tax=Bacillus xiapuensis TaxID=2014075 RepID=A0ABU6NBU6_9BACI|nr:MULTISPECIES: hypothetical protein [Bacillus]MED3563545.1 hypothetical protein [Bacillus xiapuensis]OIK10946.1 hypothetical protein BIV60_19430 [Bacillus sp. MUM 116]